MGRNRDDCLSFFDIVEHFENYRIYQCKYCSKNIKSSSSTRLKAHLKRCKGYKAVEGSVDAPYKKLLFELFLTYDLPKNILNDKKFMRLFLISPNSVKGLTRIFSEVSQNLLKDVSSTYSTKFENVCSYLNRKSFLTLGLDTFKDSLDRMTLYITIIADRVIYHLKTVDFTSIPLTEDLIISGVESVFEKINPKNFNAIISESAIIFNRSKSRIYNKYPHLVNVCCSATMFHKLSEKVVNQKKEFCECIDICMNIIGVLRENKFINNRIRKMTKIEVPQFEKEKWCTIYDFILYIAENRSALEDGLSGDTIYESLDETFWDCCSEIVNFLHPFSIAIKIAENTFSNLSNVYIPFLTIKNHLYNQCVSKMLINEFVSKMNVYMLEFCYLINPLHNKSDIDNMDLVKSEEFLLSIEGIDERIVSDFRSFVMKKDKFEDYFDAVTDPIVWWKLNRFLSPELSDMAVKYLSVPASSIYCKDNLNKVVDKLIQNNKLTTPVSQIDELVFTLQDFPTD